MANTDSERISELIERLGRINAAEEWTGDLNPSQWAALAYLARANRFSRAPSQVAEFMAATRGTVSQTLKVLARKGLASELRGETDRRWVSYHITDAGAAALSRAGSLARGVDAIPSRDRETLARLLADVLQATLEARGMRAFGMCRTCRHFRARGSGGHCALLGEMLAPEETGQICHEHERAA